MGSIITPLVVKASDLGCALDCNLLTGAKIGGGSPTDDTATINGFLAQATATVPIKLIMDGGSACHGIKIPATGHVTIEGMGMDSGFYVISGANAHAIANEPGAGGSGYPPFDPGTTPPTQGANVTVRDMFINGNRGNGTTGNSTTGNPNGTAVMWFCGLDLISLTDVLIENVTLYDIATYSIRLGNVTRWAVRGCTLNAPSNAGNTDGVHVDGPASYGNISHNTFITMGDDSIALNAPEGFSGAISQITISDNTFLGCTTACRAYGWGGGRNPFLANIVMSNNTGSFQVNSVGFATGVHLIGLNQLGTKNVDTVQDLSSENFAFNIGAVGQPVSCAEPCGSLSFSGYKWLGPLSAYPFFGFWESNVGVSSLLLSNCSIYRNAAGNAAAYGVAAITQEGGAKTGCVIKKLTVDGFSIENESGTSYSAIPYLIDMAGLSIGELLIENLDPTNITALVNPTTGFAGITSISGAGVLGTGFHIPDSVMSNNCPYISSTGANAGQPCIKIGGVVHAILAAAALPAATHDESLTDGNSNFIFAGGDIVTVIGIPN
jgi:hypothetical protein